MTVNILPCFCSVEGELVRHDAHDGAIFIVQDFIVERYAAAEERYDRWHRRYAPPEGTRIFCEWVECDTVYSKANEIGDELIKVLVSASCKCSAKLYEQLQDPK